MLIVDDRTFVVGLAELFRARMKRYETTVLLPLAEAACRDAQLTPAEVPIEGYYAESQDLAAFFRLVRALQTATRPAGVRPRESESLSRLRFVLGSPAMGRTTDTDALLPRLDSPLGEALRESSLWSVEMLSRESRGRVRGDDASLVAVAAATGDPVALCVARETMALASAVEMSDENIPEYRWMVSPAVAEVAARFVQALAEATGIALPAPVADSAAVYRGAAEGAGIAGQCICIGARVEASHPFYHWYIARRESRLAVQDFWSSSIWTTQDFRRLPESSRPVAGARVGAPARSSGSTP